VEPPLLLSRCIHAAQLPRVVWEFGQIRALPLFPGGYNSFATGTNGRRQTVGWSENGVHDPTCTGTQVLQFRR
jgi:hypothetical protein